MMLIFNLEKRSVKKSVKTNREKHLNKLSFSKRVQFTFSVSFDNFKWKTETSFLYSLINY